MNATIHATPRPPGAREQPYWNPYAVGALLGLVLLASYLVAGRGLGATGAFSSIAAWIANAISPGHALANPVHARYLASGSPLTAWLVFLLIGAFAGAALSGWLAGRTRFMIEKGPRLSGAQRLRDRRGAAAWSRASGRRSPWAARAGRPSPAARSSTWGAWCSWARCSRRPTRPPGS